METNYEIEASRNKLWLVSDVDVEEKIHIFSSAELKIPNSFMIRYFVFLRLRLYGLAEV